VNALQAAVLGLVQGLGEFLPISSSGHLVVVPWLLGWSEHGLSFDVALHVGTLAAVAFAFWRDWATLLWGSLGELRSGQILRGRHSRLLFLLVLASIPGAVAGLLFDHWAETTFRSPLLVAFDMAALGAVLWWADTRGTGSLEVPGIRTRDALLVGLAQALAIVPGVSRSGATISMGLLLGYRREEAARFSFLLALPITAGAALVKVPHLFRAGGEQGPLLIGMLVAAVSGFWAIRFLLAFVKTRSYLPFVLYRFGFATVVGLVLLVRSGMLG
jgi:undecaprenyl-diphosphatase